MKRWAWPSSINSDCLASDTVFFSSSKLHHHSNSEYSSRDNNEVESYSNNAEVG